MTAAADACPGCGAEPGQVHRDDCPTYAEQRRRNAEMERGRTDLMAAARALRDAWRANDKVGPHIEALADALDRCDGNVPAGRT